MFEYIAGAGLAIYGIQRIFMKTPYYSFDLDEIASKGAPNEFINLEQKRSSLSNAQRELKNAYYDAYHEVYYEWEQVEKRRYNDETESYETYYEYEQVEKERWNIPWGHPSYEKICGLSHDDGNLERNSP